MSSSKFNGNPLKDYDLNVEYYELLGVEQTADVAAIKKAYLKKSLQLHPGKSKFSTAGCNPDSNVTKSNINSFTRISKIRT
jgi:curved DNA-binding protein CbpA